MAPNGDILKDSAVEKGKSFKRIWFTAKMAFVSTRVCFVAVFQIIFPFHDVVGQSVSNWGPWGKCSKSCDGEQTRTRTCTSSSDCEQRLEDRRECSSSSCFSLEMILSLALICAAIVAVIIVIFVILFKIKMEKSAIKDEESNISKAIERMYDNSISTHSSTIRHMPSVESFPEPLPEPEETGLDDFVFDTESLNESIREVSCSFGADEEFQPKEQPKNEKRMSLKVVSVTETQIIDRDQDLVSQEPQPVYAVVVKPPNDVKL